MRREKIRIHAEEIFHRNLMKDFGVDIGPTATAELFTGSSGSGGFI